MKLLRTEQLVKEAKRTMEPIIGQKSVQVACSVCGFTVSMDVPAFTSEHENKALLKFFEDHNPNCIKGLHLIELSNGVMMPMDQRITIAGGIR